MVISRRPDSKLEKKPISTSLENPDLTSLCPDLAKANALISSNAAVLAATMNSFLLAGTGFFFAVFFIYRRKKLFFVTVFMLFSISKFYLVSFLGFFCNKFSFFFRLILFLLKQQLLKQLIDDSEKVHVKFSF